MSDKNLCLICGKRLKAIQLTTFPLLFNSLMDEETSHSEVKCLHFCLKSRYFGPKSLDATDVMEKASHIVLNSLKIGPKPTVDHMRQMRHERHLVPL